MAKILVVDDDQVIRETLKQSLHEDGYEVDLASHGGNALSLLRKSSTYDLIITDLAMPVFDGRAFLKAKEAEAEWKKIPIFVVSSENELSGIRERVFQKPLDFSVLSYAIKALLK